MTEIELLLKIVENIQDHVLVINQEMGMVQQDVAVLKSQIGELMWLTRAIAVAVLGVIIERGAKIYIGWKANRNK